MVIFGHFVKPIYSKVKKRKVWKNGHFWQIVNPTARQNGEK